MFVLVKCLLKLLTAHLDRLYGLLEPSCLKIAALSGSEPQKSGAADLLDLLKLESHCHANFSRLFYEFCRGLSQDIRANWSRRFLTCLKILCEFFRQNDGCASFMRVSRTCRREILANLQFKIFATLVQMLCECRTTVLRKHAKTSRLSGEKIKLRDIRTNVVQHSHECCATVVRIKMKLSYIRGKVLRHSHECRVTVMQQYCSATVARRLRDSREICFQS